MRAHTTLKVTVYDRSGEIMQEEEGDADQVDMSFDPLQGMQIGEISVEVTEVEMR